MVKRVKIYDFFFLSLFKYSFCWLHFYEIFVTWHAYFRLFLLRSMWTNLNISCIMKWMHFSNQAPTLMKWITALFSANVALTIELIFNYLRQNGRFQCPQPFIPYLRAGVSTNEMNNDTIFDTDVALTIELVLGQLWRKQGGGENMKLIFLTLACICHIVSFPSKCRVYLLILKKFLVSKTRANCCVLTIWKHLLASRFTGSIYYGLPSSTEPSFNTVGNVVDCCIILCK